MTKRRPERILLGRIVGASGLQGWLKVHSDTRPRAAIGNYKHWQLGKNSDWQTQRVDEVKCQGKRILGKLTDCDSREAAEALIGFDIAIDAEQLDSPAEGQFYWVDLQGLEVIGERGESFGTIARVIDTGANDVIVVKGDREHMIPWVMGDVILAVDLEVGTVTVDWDADF